MVLRVLLQGSRHPSCLCRLVRDSSVGGRTLITSITLPSAVTMRQWRDFILDGRWLVSPFTYLIVNS